MQAILQEEGLVALSIVQKLVPRSMVNPIASISSQPLPCVQQKVLMLQKRVKELEAICHRDSTQMMCQCSSCQIPRVFGEFLLWFPWEWCMLARFVFASCIDPCEAATLLLSVLQTCNMYGWSRIRLHSASRKRADYGMRTLVCHVAACLMLGQGRKSCANRPWGATVTVEDSACSGTLATVIHDLTDIYIVGAGPAFHTCRRPTET